MLKYIPVDKETYYSKDNKMISTSKAHLYDRNRQAYIERYIDGTLEDKSSAPMNLGKMADVWFEYGNGDKIPELFTTDKKNPDGKHVVTEGQMKKANAMGNTLVTSALYQELKMFPNLVMQMALGMSDNGVEICGMPDAFSYELDAHENTVNVTIFDLKTTGELNLDPLVWQNHCDKYGYFWQFGVYEKLVETYLRDVVYKEMTGLNFKFKFYHVIVTSDGTDGVHKVDSKSISQAWVSSGWNSFKSAVGRMRNDDFKKEEKTLKDSEVI